MATLNPIPNPAVMLVQAGTFLVTLFVAKKMILEPYLQVRKFRYFQTKGKSEETERLLLENQKRLNEFNEKVQEAVVKAKEGRSAHKSQALKERDEILKEAEQSSQEIISQTKQRVQEEIRAEKAKIPMIVDHLVRVLFDQVVS